MPLVVLCGAPQTGKSRYAQILHEYFLSKTELRVIIINEETLCVDKLTAYSANESEKNLRASLKSSVERDLSKNTIVILDSLNYIKGYRYELFCLVRTVQTTMCIVYFEVPFSQSLEWNQVYPQELLEDLSNRMEVPQEKNRWDRPLFVIRPNGDLQLEEIEQSLLSNRVLRVPVSTKVDEALESDYLYQVNKETQFIIDAVLNIQETYGLGVSVNIPETSLEFSLNEPLTLIKLKKKREAFMKMNKMTPCPIQDVKATFLDYIKGFN